MVFFLVSLPNCNYVNFNNKSCVISKKDLAVLKIYLKEFHYHLTYELARGDIFYIGFPDLEIKEITRDEIDVLYKFGKAEPADETEWYQDVVSELCRLEFSAACFHFGKGLTNKELNDRWQKLPKKEKKQIRKEIDDKRYNEYFDCLFAEELLLWNPRLALKKKEVDIGRKYQKLIDLCKKFEETLDISLLKKIKKYKKYDDGYAIYSTVNTTWYKLTNADQNLVEKLFGISLKFSI